MSNLQDLADLIKRYREEGAVHNRKGIVLKDSKPDTTLFHLMSEVGELAAAHAFGDNEELRKELGDCFNVLINFAYTSGCTDEDIYLFGAMKMNARFDLPSGSKTMEETC